MCLLFPNTQVWIQTSQFSPLEAPDVFLNFEKAWIQLRHISNIHLNEIKQINGVVISFKQKKYL